MEPSGSDPGMRFTYADAIQTVRRAQPRRSASGQKKAAEGPSAAIHPVRRWLVIAHAIVELIETGRLKNQVDAARWLGVTQTRIRHIVQLTFLAPDIQEWVLRASPQDLAGLTERDLRRIAMHDAWEDQSVALRKLRAGTTGAG